MRVNRSFVAGAAGASLVIAAFAGGVVQPQLAAVSGAVHFTASGDFSARSETTAVLNQIKSLDPDLHLALGDLSYGVAGQEQSWCNFVTSSVGAGFPFELIAGNHESNGLNGNINDFSACLPNQLPGVVGTYGRQYYADVPLAAPLVRFIGISPNLSFPDGNWSYAVGSSRYQWTAAAIDSARSAGIPWVVVGMHMPCLSLGNYACSSGADIINLLVSKRVDLVLSGHEHMYSRTKQLATGAACAQLVPDNYSAGCVADTDSDVLKGAGTVFAIVGTGGVPLRDVATTDPEVQYFLASSGLNQNPSWGNLDVTVDSGQLTAQFRSVNGGTFSDNFTIGGTAANMPPTAAFTTSCVDLACDVDASSSADVDGTIAAYAWDFGDGATANGAIASHGFAAAGSYPIALTVTDNGGLTSTITQTAIVTDPAVPDQLAADTFARTTSSAWGSADVGGAWQIAGTPASFFVADGGGHHQLTKSGMTLNTYLNAVASTATDLRFTITMDKVPNGSGAYVFAYGRRVPGGGAYLGKLNLRADGQVGLSLARSDVNGGSEVALASVLRIPGLTFVAGDKLSVRLQVSGVGPTVIQAKVWKSSESEPTTWQRTVTDTTAALQSAGGIGLKSYLSTSTQNTPIGITFDDLTATTP